MQPINTLKKGDYFRLKADGKTTYIFNGYCRINRRYEAVKADDISAFRYIPKTKLVHTNFEY